MLQRSVAAFSVSLFSLLIGSGASRADTPVLDDGALDDACAAAKTLDACPTCTCTLVTSTSPLAGTAEVSKVPIAAILEVRLVDSRTDWKSAAHLVMGTRTKLEHLGRIGSNLLTADKHSLSYEIESRAQVLQACPGGCAFEAVGLVHPFEVKLTDYLMDDNSMETSVDATYALLCFDGNGGASCGMLPVAREERRLFPGMAPGEKTRMVSKEGFKRTWKLGNKGDLVLGKASGKLSALLQNPKGARVPLVELFGQPDAVLLTR